MTQWTFEKEKMPTFNISHINCPAVCCLETHWNALEVQVMSCYVWEKSTAFNTLYSVYKYFLTTGVLAPYLNKTFLFK